jgi:hypothetical protein
LSREAAGRERARLHGLFEGTLAGVDSEITASGLHYRIRTSTPLPLSDAAEPCRKIRAAGQACMLVKRP